MSLTTLERTVRRGPVQRIGTKGTYHELIYGPGEPRTVRRELLPSGKADAAMVSLAHFVHFTDLQIVDVQSPGRFEFFEMLRGFPGEKMFVPAHRPQEALNVRAAEAVVRTLNALPASPDTGAALQLAAVTGDSLDNAQLNELRWFLALMTGGDVTPFAGSPTYAGVQSEDWPNAAYWHPGPSADRFKTDWGFPTCPQMLAQAFAPFHAEGLRLPWLSTFGNHDGLTLGTALSTPIYTRLVTGTVKPVALPTGFDPVPHAEEFLSRPESFMTGPTRTVQAAGDRRPAGRPEFVQAHFADGGQPAGHGFASRPAADGIAYGVYDLPGGPVPVRFLVLDTTNMDGHYDGSIGVRQLQWLEEQLIATHSQFFDRDGKLVKHTGDDRLIILLSHHGLQTLVNKRQDATGSEDDQPRATLAEIEALLHRFANVVLWMNGHRHLNDIQPRPDPAGLTAGFWEISTAAIADFPCQLRLVEVVAMGRETLAILTSMVDTAVPADPGEAAAADDVNYLAALHRELAANDPDAGFAWQDASRPGDRNATLLLPAPFLLHV
ncbi:MAG: TIGR03767 family metallophosphoesterase [Thermoleophilia bacterium]